MSCPICGKPTLAAMRPFCSKRCADVDLARWFNEDYAVASDDPEDLADVEEAMARASHQTETRQH
ncbi:MAG: DNA gyrase inhibitor YacG [Pseudomonadota bacterium]